MMLARKWDRIENLVKKHGYDVFNAIVSDPSANGPIDDIRDLRRYLLLVEAEMTLRGAFETKTVLMNNHGQGPMVPRFQDDGA